VVQSSNVEMLHIVFASDSGDHEILTVWMCVSGKTQKKVPDRA